MSYKQRCTETVIMIKISNGKCKTLRALLDSGCTKTIILKQFTEKSNRTYLPPDQQVKYKTYGGYFTSSLVANMPHTQCYYSRNRRLTGVTLYRQI